ncbi:hypothetical protein FNF29_02825 [Cafeteria roenbergensis]|uniref:Uncharacterized protein n=1 Tax=Cafeteria roenbergensis TaxID=33653 RepID=A0A5A8CL74_CAFRO|nr:hypothetical protein FNF29_02825 [Cafeteria roenbergensis]|eukprot:KAA0153836.1 hypothetical protein FNF29_02825 [Cafeteria roenbergensis]
MAKLVLAALALAMAAAPAWASICSVLNSHLPSHCHCSDTSRIGASVKCGVDFLHLDNIGVQADFAPCAMPAHMSLAVTDSKFHVHHTIAGLTFGKEGNYPIPGLSLHIPKLGNAGVQVAFQLQGSAKAAQVKVGLDACGSIAGHKVCGSKVISKLPLWLISGKFSFGHICSAYEADMLAMAEAAASAPMPFAPVITDMSPSSLDGFAPLVVEGLDA